MLDSPPMQSTLELLPSDVEIEIGTELEAEPEDKVSPSVRVDLSYEPVKETRDFLLAGEEVERMKDYLIREHRELSHLAGVNFVFLFCKKSRSRNGSQILGSAKVFPARDRLIHHYEFQITLDRMFWDDNPDKREALLFHELLHCYKDSETGRLSLRGHDLEEFSVVVRKYGLWKNDVRAFMQQASS